jgi:hypothetical protein
VRKLREAGARDIHPSTRREWANFYAGDSLSVVYFVYWSQRDGVYYVTRQDPDGGSMRQVGRFFDLDLAVALAVAPNTV